MGATWHSKKIASACCTLEKWKRGTAFLRPSCLKVSGVFAARCCCCQAKGLGKEHTNGALQGQSVVLCSCHEGHWGDLICKVLAIVVEQAQGCRSTKINLVCHDSSAGGCWHRHPPQSESHVHRLHVSPWPDNKGIC